MRTIKLAIALTACIAILTSCTIFGWVVPTTGDGTSSATIDRYTATEVRDYKGVRLDPSVGPRDNSIKGVQNVDIASYSLQVTGLAEKPISLNYDEVLAMDAYERLITLYCVEGWEATVLWKGARLKDIIDLAGAKETADTVIFHCVDGYTTSMPLQTIIDKDMLLAYNSNGIELPASLGFPFIVVAEDKLGYKWARWVNEIELTDNAYYQGFWEKNGYDNTADVPDSR